jgi:Lrp/AsnC family leucine-responsive transcriptional regulator
LPDKSTVDRIDRKILKVLQVDGRITNQDLADRVALSPSACLTRVKRMENNGVIVGYKAQVDVTKFGPNLTIFAEITASAHDPESYKRIEQTWVDMPEVIEAFQVSGRYDYLVRFLVLDMDRWTSLVDKLTDGDLKIETIRTVSMMRRIKTWRGVPMNIDVPADNLSKK